jgi:hypothetical protein
LPNPRARPWARHQSVGVFPLWFPLFAWEGRKEKRGGGEAGREVGSLRALRRCAALLKTKPQSPESDKLRGGPSTSGRKPKQRSSSRHRLPHAVATVNFTNVDVTASTTPPLLGEPDLTFSSSSPVEACPCITLRRPLRRAPSGDRHRIAPQRHAGPRRFDLFHQPCEATLIFPEHPAFEPIIRLQGATHRRSCYATPRTRLAGHPCASCTCALKSTPSC